MFTTRRTVDLQICDIIYGHGNNAMFSIQHKPGVTHSHVQTIAYIYWYEISGCV